MDSSQGIWVEVASDGRLTEVTDLAALAGHGWAWKYQDHTGKPSLHLIRGTVRNVPGEDYYLTELKGAVRFSHVAFSYVPGKRILKDVTVYANPGQKIAFVGSTGAGKTTITNLINRFYEIEGGLITYDGIDVKAGRQGRPAPLPGGGAPGHPPVHRHHHGRTPATDGWMPLTRSGRWRSWLRRCTSCVGGIQPAVADVVHDGAGEQVGVLEHRTQGAAQVVLADGPHVDAVVGDQAALDLVKAVDEVGDGGLARAGGAYEGDLLARVGVDGHIFQDALCRAHRRRPHG